MTTLEDNRTIIADLLAGLGNAAGAECLRASMAPDAKLDPDEQAELEALREFVAVVEDALNAKGSAPNKIKTIKAELEARS